MNYDYPIKPSLHAPGEMLVVHHAHNVWKDENLDPLHFPRVWKGDLVVFLQVGGFNRCERNWKRNEWNTKVIHPELGIIWVSHEYLRIP